MGRLPQLSVSTILQQGTLRPCRQAQHRLRLPRTRCGQAESSQALQSLSRAAQHRPPTAAVRTACSST